MTALCLCGCGNRPPEGNTYASPACRSKASRDRLYIRRAELAAMTDAEIFALCRKLREQHRAASALQTLTEVITASSQPKEQLPCADSPAP